MSVLVVSTWTVNKTDLAILEPERQLGLVALDFLVHQLRGHPTLGSVWLPSSGANIVHGCHEYDAPMQKR